MENATHKGWRYKNRTVNPVATGLVPVIYANTSLFIKVLAPRRGAATNRRSANAKAIRYNAQASSLWRCCAAGFEAYSFSTVTSGHLGSDAC
jgi:hypothetical protein